MKVSILALLSLVAAAIAQNTTYFITSPIAGTVWTAGKKVSITWTGGNSSLVSILLLNGPTATTENIYATIAQNVTGSVGTYSWTVPSSLASSSTYAIEITDGTGAVNSFSHAFTINSTNGTLSFSSVSSTSLVSSSSSVIPSSVSLTSSSSMMTAMSSPMVVSSSSLPSANATTTPAKSGAASYLKPAAIFAAIVPLAAALLL